jgi:acetyl esterase/lipase
MDKGDMHPTAGALVVKKGDREMSVLRIVGKLLLALMGLVVAYLIFVIFGPGFEVGKQPLPVSQPAGKKKRRPPESREDVSFEVAGNSIRAWLYLPEDVSTPVPCIVLNHGFGGTKDQILERYALRFQAAGLAVLSYDYRHFGASEGQPRQLFAIPRQLEDCSAAITYARARPEIDSDRIALWGTSAAGGYGLAIAARDKQIACLCAQCPALDSEEDGKLALEREGVGFFLRLLVHAQRDKGRSRLGLSAHTIPIVGKTGTLAMITAPGAFEGYAQLFSADFVNEVCARVLLTTEGFNPIDHAPEVECQTLLQLCEHDNLVSPRSASNTAEILGDLAQLEQYPIGHFDIYQGEHFERAVNDQIEFFSKHLGLTSKA